MTNEVKPISDLEPSGVKVLLMRRTRNDNVKTAVGYLWPGERIPRGWFGSLPPTHFCSLPPFPKDE